MLEMPRRTHRSVPENRSVCDQALLEAPLASALSSARTESDLVDLEEVLIMVTDATGLSATSSVLLRVIASNDPPVINVPGTTFDERLSTVDGLSRQRVDVALISGIEDTVLAIPEIRVRDVDAAEPQPWRAQPISQCHQLPELFRAGIAGNFREHD